MNKKTKQEYQLCLRSNDEETEIEDFELDAFFPPLAKGQRLELPNHVGTVFVVVDSTVEIRHLVERKIMRFSTILYIQSEEKGRSF